MLAQNNSLINSQTMNQLTSKAQKASTMLVQRYSNQGNMMRLAEKFARKFSQKLYQSLPNYKEAAQAFAAGMLTPQGLDVMENLVQSEVEKVFN